MESIETRIRFATEVSEVSETSIALSRQGPEKKAPAKGRGLGFKRVLAYPEGAVCCNRSSRRQRKPVSTSLGTDTAPFEALVRM
jgi:hypothetical protein